MTQDVAHVMTPQDCLLALMIAVSASDENILTAELMKIQSTLNHLPIFAKYDMDRLNVMSQLVFDLFEQEDGLDALFGLVKDNLEASLCVLHLGSRKPPFMKFYNLQIIDLLPKGQ